jgi:DNA-binding Xre family transcriptional regulator
MAIATATEVFADENRTVERKMTKEELAEIAEMHEATMARKAAEEVEAAEKAIAKAALLDRLGITADEAKLLLG